jgi:hypothetical protein
MNDIAGRTILGAIRRAGFNVECSFQKIDGRTAYLIGVYDRKTNARYVVRGTKLYNVALELAAKLGFMPES